MKSFKRILYKYFPHYINNKNLFSKFADRKQRNLNIRMKQTKIVASISDRRCGVDFIRQLFLAGVNVVRMNTAHATPEGIKEIIRKSENLRTQYRRHIT